MKRMLIMLCVITSFALSGCASQTQHQAYSAPVVKKSEHPMDDAAITTKVKTAFINEKLFGDKAVSPMSISVETINGVVYLTGTADSKQEIHNAIRIAKSVHGVKGVRSSVMVVR